MRGRVMSLWFVAFQGSTPIGGPIIGVVDGLAGARAGLGVGALACALAAVVGVGASRRLHRARDSRVAPLASPPALRLGGGAPS